jgi:hypothetical protein
VSGSRAVLVGIWALVIVGAAVVAARDAPVDPALAWTALGILAAVVGLALLVARGQQQGLGDRLRMRRRRATFLTTALAPHLEGTPPKEIEAAFWEAGPQAVSYSLLAIQSADDRVRREGAEMLVDVGEDALPALRDALLEASAETRPWLEAARRGILARRDDPEARVFE